MAMSCFIFHDWEEIPGSNYVTRPRGIVDVSYDYVCLDCGKKKLTATMLERKAREDHARQTARRCKAEQLAKLPEPKAEPLSPITRMARVSTIFHVIFTILIWIWIIANEKV